MPFSSAPYGFVGLPPQDNYSPPLEGAETLSGHLDIEVTTKSWTFVRAGVNAAAFNEGANNQNAAIWNDHDKGGRNFREFFHHGDPEVPALPGSSLRGSVRTLVEILSDSRPSAVTDQTLLFRAIGGRSNVDTNYRDRMTSKSGDNVNYPRRELRAGWLRIEGGKRVIRQASQHHQRTFIRLDYNLPGQHGSSNHRAAIPDYGAPPTRVWVEPRPAAEHAALPTHGHVVYALAGEVSTVKPPDDMETELVPAWAVRTDDPTNNKHLHCAVYECDESESARVFEVPDDMWATYRRDCAKSRADDRMGRQLAGGSEEGEPCFFLLEGHMQDQHLVFFGGTLFFRLPAKHTPADFADLSQVDDPARRMFGYINGGDLVAGRVSFGDLTTAEADPFLHGSPDDPVVSVGGYTSPTPLLSPNPTALQHYLDQSKMRNGTTDLVTYDDEPNGENRIAGWKLYWHRTGAPLVSCDNPDSIEQGARDTRTIFRPVRAGVTFAGRVYFSDLNKAELGALVGALDPSRVLDHLDYPPAHGQLGHKIGSGRPLGFGSVAVEITGQRLGHPERLTRFVADDGLLYRGVATPEDDGNLIDQCVAAFMHSMDSHRDKVGVDDRMEDLRALLTIFGEDDVPAGCTPVGIDDAGSEQWRQRWIQDRPHELVN